MRFGNPRTSGDEVRMAFSMKRALLGECAGGIVADMNRNMVIFTASAPIGRRPRRIGGAHSKLVRSPLPRTEAISCVISVARSTTG